MNKFLTKSKLLISAVILSTGLFLTACDEDNGNSVSVDQNLVEIAQQNADFETLVQALGDAGLVATLSGNGPFTVFAPTDDAFNKLPAGTLGSLTNDQLVSILTYHVLPGKILSINLTDQQNPASLEGGELFVEAVSGVSVNDNASVIQADLEATNGVIHVINEVLFPDRFLDVVGVTAKRYTLETLESAVVSADLVATLQQESQDGFTVFAPTNEAFDLITIPADQQQLQEILTYHVIPAKVLSGDLQAFQSVTTVNGKQLTIEVNNGVVTVNGTATVTTADLEGTNGVVHIIDEVLEVPAN